jgi:hypothetical protein
LAQGYLAADVYTSPKLMCVHSHCITGIEKTDSGIASYFVYIVLKNG